ncbi:MAG TPA: bestrophin family ion channel [Polyangiaceae bacterium]|nr:bestrophin family ion channel [Polyangiaceae bacterium]
MIIERRFPVSTMLRWASRSVALSAAWCVVVYVLYAKLGLSVLRVPFLPIATVGTAVAFYVGFKNNAAYDRFWEGRKIWGGVVNASRTWATMVLAYVHSAPSDVPQEPGASAGGASEGLRRARACGEGSREHVDELRRELVYRHLAWVNALRLQLRKTSRFFDNPTKWTRERMAAHADHMRNDWDKELTPFLSAEELAYVSARANPATHLLSKQTEALAALRADRHLDLFHQIEMMSLIRELYDLQGRCERIKNTPLPRQYAEFSRTFVRVFAFLVPFGLLDVFAARITEATVASGVLAQWLPVLPMIGASSLVTWVFMAMEGIGDASEDPFERSMNDVPMNALSRGIEIDLRELLGETELPPREPKIGNLMY